MTRQFIILDEITFAQLVKIYSVLPRYSHFLGPARFNNICHGSVVDGNQCKHYKPATCTYISMYMRVCVSCKQAPPYSLSSQAIEHQKYRGAAFNPVPDVDLYLSAYIIIEIHVLTLLWERRAKEDFTVCACDSSMQHTTSSASDSSRYSDIQGGNTRRSNIYHVFRC